MKKRILHFLAYISATACIFSACNRNNEVSLQTIEVNFSAGQVGMEDEENYADIGITLSRAARTDLTVTVQLSSSDVDLSEDLLFTPEYSGGSIEVSIAEGETTSSITVERNSESLSGYYVYLEIVSLSDTENYRIGSTSTSSLYFGTVVNESGEMTLEGKVDSETYRNIVYVDMSNVSQVQVDRKSWNLGFYCGDENRVILNTAYKTMAAASGKTDFASVTIDDAENITLTGNYLLGQDENGYIIDNFGDRIDDVSGDLTRTIFGDLASSESTAEVFFVASEDNMLNAQGSADKSLWYKVKVWYENDRYNIQYGNISDTEPSTAYVSKNPAYNFRGLSLETGEEVTSEPTAMRWDFRWSYAAAYSESDNMYAFSQDVILINSYSGVEIATITPAETENLSDLYDSYRLSDILSATFQLKQNAIATSWRDVYSGSVTSNFYVVKDCADNYYKLMFLTFNSTGGGERGRPILKFDLLQ